METKKTYYETLNINESASLSEIKQHYHRLARLYHPDITKLSNTHDKFIEINEAYRTLKDPILRKAYDFGLRQKRIKTGEISETDRAGSGSVGTSDVQVDNNKGQKQYKARTMEDIANIDTFKKRAMSAFINKNFSEALNAIDEAMKIDNGVYDIWKIKGEIAFEQHDYDTAMEAFSKACRIDDNPEIRALLSQVISLRNKTTKSTSGKKKGGFFGLF